LLVRLDDRDLQMRLAQARESLKRAEAVRDLAQSEHDRDKGLFEKSVIPRSEFDQTDARLRTAAASGIKRKFSAASSPGKSWHCAIPPEAPDEHRQT